MLIIHQRPCVLVIRHRPCVLVIHHRPCVLVIHRRPCVLTNCHRPCMCSVKHHTCSIRQIPYAYVSPNFARYHNVWSANYHTRAFSPDTLWICSPPHLPPSDTGRFLLPSDTRCILSPDTTCFSTRSQRQAQERRIAELSGPQLWTNWPSLTPPLPRVDGKLTDRE